MPRIATEFGLGQRTGISGIDETSGLISPEWKTAELGEGWATGDAVNMAIGQGYVRDTLANREYGGCCCQWRHSTNQPWLIVSALLVMHRKNHGQSDYWTTAADPDQMATLKDALWNVANGPLGTASDRFDGLPLQSLVKQARPKRRPTIPAWFAGYAPAAPYTTQDGTYLEDPEIAISVIVENAGEGSAVPRPSSTALSALLRHPTTPFPGKHNQKINCCNVT